MKFNKPKVGLFSERAKNIGENSLLIIGVLLTALTFSRGEELKNVAGISDECKTNPNGYECSHEGTVNPVQKGEAEYEAALRAQEQKIIIENYPSAPIYNPDGTFTIPSKPDVYTESNETRASFKNILPSLTGEQAELYAGYTGGNCEKGGLEEKKKCNDEVINDFIGDNNITQVA